MMIIVIRVIMIILLSCNITYSTELARVSGQADNQCPPEEDPNSKSTKHHFSVPDPPFRIPLWEVTFASTGSNICFYWKWHFPSFPLLLDFPKEGTVK